MALGTAGNADRPGLRRRPLGGAPAARRAAGERVALCPGRPTDHGAAPPRPSVPMVAATMASPEIFAPGRTALSPVQIVPKIGHTPAQPGMKAPGRSACRDARLSWRITIAGVAHPRCPVDSASRDHMHHRPVGQALRPCTSAVARWSDAGFRRWPGPDGAKSSTSDFQCSTERATRQATTEGSGRCASFRASRRPLPRRPPERRSAE